MPHPDKTMLGLVRRGIEPEFHWFSCWRLGSFSFQRMSRKPFPKDTFLNQRCWNVSNDAMALYNANQRDGSAQVLAALILLLLDIRSHNKQFPVTDPSDPVALDQTNWKDYLMGLGSLLYLRFFLVRDAQKQDELQVRWSPWKLKPLVFKCCSVIFCLRIFFLYLFSSLVCALNGI